MRSTSDSDHTCPDDPSQSEILYELQVLWKKNYHHKGDMNLERNLEKYHHKGEMNSEEHFHQMVLLSNFGPVQVYGDNEPCSYSSWEPNPAHCLTGHNTTLLASLGPSFSPELCQCHYREAENGASNTFAWKAEWTYTGNEAHTLASPEPLWKRIATQCSMGKGKHHHMSPLSGRRSNANLELGFQAIQSICGFGLQAISPLPVSQTGILT